MSPPPSPASRVEILREPGLLRLRIRPPRLVPLAVFLAAWLGAWAFGESAALRQVLDPETPILGKAFLSFWLTGWTFGGLAVLGTLLYAVAGREEVVVEGRSVAIRYRALGLGWTRRFDTAAIESLEAASPGPTPRVPRKVPGALRPAASIALRSGGKELRFGHGLGPQDVERVLGELRGRLGLRGLQAP